MLNQPRPKRFQIHLSTAVVLMFVAGALLWANLVPHPEYYRFPEKPTRSSGYFYNSTNYGWPKRFIYKSTITYFDYDQEPYGSDSSNFMDTWNFLVDTFLALAILVSVWIGLEKSIRWRVAHRPS